MLAVPDPFLKILIQTSLALSWCCFSHASNAAAFANARTDLGLTATLGTLPTLSSASGAQRLGALRSERDEPPTALAPPRAEPARAGVQQGAFAHARLARRG